MDRHSREGGNPGACKRLDPRQEHAGMTHEKHGHLIAWRSAEARQFPSLTDRVQPRRLPRSTSGAGGGHDAMDSGLGHAGATISRALGVLAR